MKLILFLSQLFIHFILIIAKYSCPIECECYYKSLSFTIDCASKTLQELPDQIDENVENLSLSNNLFTSVPSAITSFTLLEKLNMSKNSIKDIKSDAFANLTNLKILDLSENKISMWQDINPTLILLPLTNLKILILSKNPFIFFSNLNRTENLVSENLETLELERCGISIVDGKSPLGGLTALKHLKLSFNPIKKLQLVSTTLEKLDASHCQLTRIPPDSLNFLPLLTHLYLSHNYRLYISSKTSSISSSSLLYVDLSFCNMDKVTLTGLPNVEVLILRGNMIRSLTGGEFVNNYKLIQLDLSSNAIGMIHYNTFLGLQSLKFLNLSVNVVSKIYEETFSHTPNLTKLIMSRNYISTLQSIKSSSIVELDVNTCEIQSIDPHAFLNMSSLLKLDLSRNLIHYLPDGLKSNSLQQFDLRFNRISNINNLTFRFLPSLLILRLSGNRFTAPFKTSYFANNTKLLEIYLDDNMWRCDCSDEDMKNLFSYLTKEPAKIWDVNTLTCHSPSDVSGQSWLKACYFTWYPQNGGFTTNKAMNFIIALLIAFSVCFLILCVIRRSMRIKMVAEQEERNRRTEEARERLREFQMRREQESLRNAPDPRDLVSPPSYAEALLMPRLDSSFHSLSNIEVHYKKRKKRTPRRTRSSGDILDENENTENNERRRRRKRLSDGRNLNDRENRSQSTDNMIATQNGENNEEQAATISAQVHESDL